MTAPADPEDTRTSYQPRHRGGRRFSRQFGRPARAAAIASVAAFAVGSATLWLTGGQPGELASLIRSETSELPAEGAQARVLNAPARARIGGPDDAPTTTPSGATSTIPATPSPSGTPTASATPTPSATTARPTLAAKSTRQAKSATSPQSKKSGDATKKPDPKPSPKPTSSDGRPAFKLPFACGVKGRLTTYSGHDPDDMKLDIFNAEGESRGTPVVASAAGVVDRVKLSNGQVKIDHGGRWYTMYIHMEGIVVQDGQRVEEGQKIGEVGSVNTGVAHLHYEQIYDQNNDGYGSSPWEITYPIIQGVKYSLSPGDEPIVTSENGC